jgi:hypothetical protein
MNVLAPYDYQKRKFWKILPDFRYQKIENNYRDFRVLFFSFFSLFSIF